MKKLKKPILLISSLCFVAGVAWSLWSEHKQRLQMSRATPLRVLCHETWLTEARLKEFSHIHQIPIQHWTYSNPSEFLRQMANADGKIDVVCTSSMLLRSLVQSRWVKKENYFNLSNARHLSVDFLHLPYDPQAEYSVPLFWNLYGIFGKRDLSSASWKQTLSSNKLSFWGDELNILHLLSRLGVRIEERIQDKENRLMEREVRQFFNSTAQVLQPGTKTISAEALMARSDLSQLPVAQVARLLGEKSPYSFSLPTDGGMVDVGLLAIGEKAGRPELARQLIDHLISTEHAHEVHQRLGAGVVHSTLNHMASIAPLQRSDALRSFPLTRFSFPDVSLDAVPRFQKIFNETMKARELNR